MDTVTLKRGRGTVNLVKSEDLIAIRSTSQAEVAEVLASVPGAVATVDIGANVGGFEIVKVHAAKDKMEETLDRLRSHYLVDAGTHVYHTPRSNAPIVPTGKITLRFTPDSTFEQRQKVLDENHLEIVESSVKQKDGGATVETFTVRTTPDALNPLKIAEKLQRDSGVVSLAEPDLATPGQLLAFQMPADTYLREQWHLKNDGTQFGTSLGLKPGADARVVAAWQRAQSLGSPACIVAVIDDGFDLSHPDLSGNSKVVAPWDFTTNTDNPAPKRFHPDTRRGDYHGTACAGVAIGNPSGGGIIGAAPGSRFMPVRWNSSVSDDTVRQQFGYVAQQGAWVVSCSWGVAADEFYLSTTMDEAIAECATQGRNGLGCVIVFAAGNDNHDINDPQGGTVDGFATHPDVIAVAACNSRDEKSNYSNFGKEISICAPSSGVGGRGILTSDVRGTFQFLGVTYEAGYEAGDYTRTFGGTSSATPLVAGICALVLSVNPALTSRQVKQILEATARRIGNHETYDESGHSIYYGYGCVDADAAVRMALESMEPMRDAGMRRASGNRVADNSQAGYGGKAVAADEPAREDGTLYASEFWGISRHELIAGAADRLLNQEAREQMERILAPLGGQTSLRDIAGWADRIKGGAGAGTDPDTAEFLRDFPNEESRDWHYVNLPLGVASYAEAKRMEFTRSDDVVEMIGVMVRVLRGDSKVMSKLNALRWLVHLAGDAHQPLHVGCAFIDTGGGMPALVTDPSVIRQKRLTHDRGGNSLVLPIGGETNLHAYWDSRVPGTIDTREAAAADEHAEGDDEMKRRFITRLVAMIEEGRTGMGDDMVGLAETLSPDRWAEQWANQALMQARAAYDGLRIADRLGDGKYKVEWEGKAAYDRRCKPIVSAQLSSAAKNLAELLNLILGAERTASGV
jgi:subtilisin family serine protease